MHTHTHTLTLTHTHTHTHTATKAPDSTQSPTGLGGKWYGRRFPRR